MCGFSSTAKAAELIGGYSTDTSQDGRMKEVLKAVNSEVPFENLKPHAKSALRGLLEGNQSSAGRLSNTAFIRAFSGSSSNLIGLGERIVDHVGNKNLPGWEDNLSVGGKQ